MRCDGNIYAYCCEECSTKHYYLSAWHLQAHFFQCTYDLYYSGKEKRALAKYLSLN